MKYNGILKVMALVIALPTMSLAATDSPQIVAKPSNMVYEGTSEANRLNKKASVLVELLGLGAGYTNGMGIGGTYHLNSNQLLNLELKSGRMDNFRQSTIYSNGVVTDQSQSELTNSSISGGFKQFSGNSFYYKLGLDYTMGKYNYRFDGYRAEYEGSSIGASIAIGNQWQWDSFTIGCDWVGYRTPISTNTKTNKIVGSIDKDDEKSFNDDVKILFKDSNLMLLKFYLGASF